MFYLDCQIVVLENTIFDKDFELESDDLQTCIMKILMALNLRKCFMTKSRVEETALNPA